MYRKGKRYEKIFEIAHIYPLNPSDLEREELKDLEILYQNDPNELNNVICLCPNCHTKFDKPRTKEEYLNLVDVKKKFLELSQSRQKWHEFSLEEDIQTLIRRLADEDYDLDNVNDELEYDPKELGKKLNSSITALISKKIERNVSEFYPIVSHIFKQQDYLSPLTTEKVSAQIKLYYLSSDNKEDQRLMFKNTVNWIHAKTGSYSLEAAEIIASYFVQNCELFEA